jgi:hypothetical protein
MLENSPLHFLAHSLVMRKGIILEEVLKSDVSTKKSERLFIFVSPNTKDLPYFTA